MNLEDDEMTPFHFCNICQYNSDHAPTIGKIMLNIRNKQFNQGEYNKVQEDRSTSVGRAGIDDQGSGPWRP